MRLDPFFDNLPTKRVKLYFEDIDAEGIDRPLEEMSEEQLRKALEGKEVKVVDVRDLEEEIIEDDEDDDDDVRAALSEIFIEFYLHLRVLAVDQDLFPVFARFAKKETLLAGRWRDRFPKRASPKARREFCQTLRHRYFIHGAIIASKAIDAIRDEIATDPSFYKQKGITDYTEFLDQVDQLDKKDECGGEEIDFLLYWGSTSPIEELGSELQQALDLASSLSPKNGSICDVDYESLLKAGLKLPKSDWDFISNFFSAFLEGLSPDSGIDQKLRRSEDLAFKVAHSRCRAELQDKVLALAVSAGGGDISVFTHILICRDVALEHRTFEEFQNALPEQWEELIEYLNTERVTE